MRKLYFNTVNCPINAQDSFLECGALTKTGLNGVILTLCKWGWVKIQNITVMNIDWEIFWEKSLPLIIHQMRGRLCPLRSSASLWYFRSLPPPPHTHTHTHTFFLFCFVLLFVISFQKHLVLLCLRAPLIIGVIIYEPVHDLHDNASAFVEEFRRHFSHWCFLCQRL